MQRGPLSRDERRVEGLVLFLIERAVQVVGFAAAIAGGGKNFVHVQAVGGDDGGHRIVKAQPVAAGQGGDSLAQFAVGQGAGGHQDGLALIDSRHFLPVDGDVGFVLHHGGNRLREPVPVHGQGAAGSHAGSLGGGQQMGAPWRASPA